jgi:hypothetical protein
MLVHPSGMERIRSGRAYCAICGEVIRPEEDALVSPDFLADETDPFWRFSDAPMHRACFLVWDRRKAFIARYNRMARRWLAPDGSHLHLTSEGDIVTRQRRDRLG